MIENAPFQIRDFPVPLREEIVREAKHNEMSVGDFMTGICTAAREAGWLRSVRPHVPHTLNRLSTDQTAPKLQHPLESLTLIACDFALRRNEMGERLAGAIERKLLAAIRALPTPPRPRHQPAALLPSRHGEHRPVNGEERTGEAAK